MKEDALINGGKEKSRSPIEELRVNRGDAGHGIGRYSEEAIRSFRIIVGQDPGTEGRLWTSSGRLWTGLVGPLYLVRGSVHARRRNHPQAGLSPPKNRPNGWRTVD
jgi:hypothetical protein